MKNFSKVLLITLFGSLIYSSSARADWDYYAIGNIVSTGSEIGGFTVYTCESGICSEKGTQRVNGWNAEGSYVNDQNELIIQGRTGDYVTSKYYKYNPITNTITAIDDWKDNYAHTIERKVITKGSNGTISIGDNSLKLKETATTQEMWATNSSGSIAPINITNGTKLLINGRDVEQSIDNVGALSAALTALPTVPTDSPIACGIGTGTHSGNYAFSGGCTSKVNEKLSFNAAASFVPGQEYQGTDNSYSARAGFVFKLGELSKPTQISFNEKKIIDKKLSTLEENNKNLNAELKLSKAKNDEIISQNQKLLARLEKLENIALKFQSSSEMISVATKD